MQTINNLDLAIYSSVHESPLGLKGVAFELGVGEQVFRNKVNPHCVTHKVSAFEISRIIEVTGDPRIAQAIAGLSGGHFVPTRSRSPKHVFKALLAYMKEHGELISAIERALDDGQVTHAEYSAIQKELADVSIASSEMAECIAKKAGV